MQMRSDNMVLKSLYITLGHLWFIIKCVCFSTPVEISGKSKYTIHEKKVHCLSKKLEAM